MTGVYVNSVSKTLLVMVAVCRSNKIESTEPGNDFSRIEYRVEKNFDYDVRMRSRTFL